MNSSAWRVVLAGLVLVLGAAAAPATVLTFDDVTTSTYAEIPDGYGGFDWGSFGVVDPVAYPAVPSGYYNGIVSPTYVALNPYGTPADLWVAAPERFDFNGAYLTGAWNDGLSVRVQGYRTGTLVYDETVITGAYAPTWFQFDFLDVDRLLFTSFGGADAGFGIGSGEHFAMDNFTFNEAVAVPEPLTVAGLALGLGALGTYLRRRK